MEAPAHHALDPGSSGGLNLHLPDEVSVRQVSGFALGVPRISTRREPPRFRLQA